MNALPVSLPFTDRAEAGRRLADRVRPYAAADPLVLALPRGGVPVAAQLARALGAELDVLVVRKIGLPGHAEVGVGALAEDGRACFDDDALARLRVPREALDDVVRAERVELARRLEVYRGRRPAPRVAGRDVIVVDDGAATGGTARAALRTLRRSRPARLTLAVPVAAPQAVAALRAEADHVVVLTCPENFRAVGEWYRDFTQLSDADVTSALESARGPAGGAAERAVRIRAGGTDLDGELAAPASVRGAAVFAVGRGRAEPSVRATAAAVREAGYATLVLDLLDAEESAAAAAEGGAAVSTADLAERLDAAVRWLRRSTDVAGRRVGLFGAGTAAPAAIAAAARNPGDVAAVVAFGGRIDLAEDALARVRCPVLVLLPSADSFVRELAEWAVARLGGPAELRVVAGAEAMLADAEEWHGAGTAVAHWFDRHR
ncbi:phosphoribosyltransferase family protein [Nocardiopsis trehalosi]|jgi:putative phosphoribosyl transferase|uniref:phosphoribosyltransferase family protein n=1 Tax=Nocardiopsis trehalosi TaxID=109329 RepID=UPI00082A3BCA|nr:phosphoribosyltransferase family protein [Nocardiopsis trehalosi]